MELVVPSEARKEAGFPLSLTQRLPHYVSVVPQRQFVGGPAIGGTDRSLRRWRRGGGFGSLRIRLWVRGFDPSEPVVWLCAGVSPLWRLCSARGCAVRGFALLSNGIRASRRKEMRCSAICKGLSAQADSKPQVGNRSLAFEGAGLSTSVLQWTSCSALLVSQPPP
ncbi:hypothetical protein U1Q18_002541 [Sarracenia purpurea var. burkii]